MTIFSAAEVVSASLSTSSLDCTMDYGDFVLSCVFIGVPPLSCASAWFFWARESKSEQRGWRRTTTTLGLAVLTLSIVSGVFALIYWRRFPGNGSGPPDATYFETHLGFILAVVSLPLCVLARHRTRISSTICFLALLGFYFLMYLSP